jgi:hypothetical protein
MIWDINQDQSRSIQTRSAVWHSPQRKLGEQIEFSTSCLESESKQHRVPDWQG